MLAGHHHILRTIRGTIPNSSDPNILAETTPFPKEEEFIYEEAAEEADVGFFCSNKALRVLGFGWGLG